MSTESRRIVAVFNMPNRLTPAERVATMDADVRDATARLRRTITDKALTFGVGGYALDEDSWEFAANGRTIIGSAVVRREA